MKSFKQKFHFTSVSQQEKMFFVQNLHTMMKTGFSLAAALNTLSLQTKNKEFIKIILDLKESVEKGQPFYIGLQKYSYIFSDIFISLIEAGETSGKLEESLNNLLKQLKKNYALKKKIKNALTYPVIIVIAMIGLGIAMFIFVFPNLINLYSESNFTLPLPTRITMAIGQFVLSNGWQIGSLAVLIIVSFFFIISKEKGKYYWHFILLKTPIIGKILLKINLANFSREFHSLILTDIPVTEIFKIVSKTLNNRIYKYYLLSIVDNLKKGDSIYSVFVKRPDLFPPVVSQMINVGEQSGTLDVIAKELAEFYEDEVSDTMANLTVIIEPIIMLAIGVGVAFIAVSVIYPIYALVNQI